MMRKVLSGIAAILAVTALVACGKADENSDELSSNETGTAVYTATPDDNEETAATYAGAESAELQKAPEDGEQPEALTADTENGAYELLKAYIEENGEEEDGNYMVPYLINDTSTLFFELDSEGRMLWTCYFDEDESKSVLTVYIDREEKAYHEVAMHMEETANGEVHSWSGVLETATLNYIDFNTVNLEITSSSDYKFAQEDVLPTMIINTQIAVLGSEIALNAFELGITVEDFGFPATL